MQFSHASNKFLTFGAAGRQYAPETRQKHRDCFVSWLLPALGTREIESVDIIDALKIRNIMEGRRLSDARISSVFSTLKALLNFSRTVLKLECMNPAEIKLPPKPKPDVEFLTDPEIDRARTALNPHRFTDRRTRAMMELILGTGVRVGEALAMDREPFDKGVTEMDIIGKGGKRRTIFFPQWCRDEINAYLRRRDDKHPALFITAGDPPQRWARADVSRYFIQLRERAGIDKDLTPHMLRHTYCTHLLHNGADIMFIKELAGHADIQTTARYYLGVDKPALRKVVNERVRYGDGDAVDRTAIAA
jgi:integrase/recombinase XerD